MLVKGERVFFPGIIPIIFAEPVGEGCCDGAHGLAVLAPGHRRARAAGIVDQNTAYPGVLCSAPERRLAAPGEPGSRDPGGIHLRVLFQQIDDAAHAKGPDVQCAPGIPGQILRLCAKQAGQRAGILGGIVGLNVTGVEGHCGAACTDDLRSGPVFLLRLGGDIDQGRPAALGHGGKDLHGLPAPFRRGTGHQLLHHGRVCVPGRRGSLFVVAEEQHCRHLFLSGRAHQYHREGQRPPLRGKLHLPDLPHCIQLRQLLFRHFVVSAGIGRRRAHTIFLRPEQLQQLLPPGIPGFRRRCLFQYHWQIHLFSSLIGGAVRSRLFSIIPSSADGWVEKVQKMLQNQTERPEGYRPAAPKALQ